MANVHIDGYTPGKVEPATPRTTDEILADARAQCSADAHEMCGYLAKQIEILERHKA